MSRLRCQHQVRLIVLGTQRWLRRKMRVFRLCLKTESTETSRVSEPSKK
jgi:hypothetical protein